MAMDPAEIGARLDLARLLAREARRVIMAHYSAAGVRFETKGDGSPVTVADRQAEEFLRREISRRCPGDAVLGEEFGATDGASGVRWVLDPIDGTRAFTHGVPLFGCMIAVESGGESVASVIDFPAIDETCWAQRGRGAWHEVGAQAARPARVSGVSRLADGVITFTGPRTPGQIAPDAAALSRLLGASRDVRGWGDCHAHMLVATGRMEAMINGKIARWDVAPLEPIVAEAGGVISDWRGGPAGDGGLGAVTSNGLVHAELIALLAGR